MTRDPTDSDFNSNAEIRVERCKRRSRGFCRNQTDERTSPGKPEKDHILEQLAAVRTSLNSELAWFSAELVLKIMIEKLTRFGYRPLMGYRGPPPRLKGVPSG